MLQICYNTQYYTEDYKGNIMVSYQSSELVSSSDIAKRFGTYLTQLREHTVEKIAVLKNNKVEAVIMSKNKYESMKEKIKTLEQEKVMLSITSGMEDVKKGRIHSIDNLIDELS